MHDNAIELTSVAGFAADRELRKQPRSCFALGNFEIQAKK